MVGCSSTATVDWPTTSPDVARIGTVPGPTAVTSPPATVAIAGSSLLQLIGRSVRTFPDTSRVVACSRSVSPMVMVSSEGSTVTECTSSAVTLTSLHDAAVRARTTPKRSRRRGNVTGACSAGIDNEFHHDGPAGAGNGGRDLHLGAVGSRI